MSTPPPPPQLLHSGPDIPEIFPRFEGETVGISFVEPNMTTHVGNLKHLLQRKSFSVQKRQSGSTRLRPRGYAQTPRGAWAGGGCYLQWPKACFGYDNSSGCYATTHRGFPSILRLVVPAHDDRVQQEGAQNVGPDVDEGRQVHPDVPPHLRINRNTRNKIRKV